MTRPRGRPAQGQGVARDDILAAALALLEQGGGQKLTMRALAARLGVTPMGLYHHVGDRAGLLRALSDQVYAEVLEGAAAPEGDPRAGIRSLLTRYHHAVGRHPQLTLAIFATPEAFAGVTRQITERLTQLLAALTAEPVLWRDILVDHAHGSGLALVAAREEPAGPAQPARALDLRQRYLQALDRLLDSLPPPAPATCAAQAPTPARPAPGRR
jgi:AcrR family transcriptional regulator